MSLLVFEPISASGLPNVALLLPMDPYIQLCLGGQAVKGTPVPGGGRSPQWERRPRNRVLVPIVGAPTRLLVEVRNRQYMMQDQLLGATTLEIGAILEGAEHAAPISLPLQDSSGAAAGELCFVVYTTSEDDDEYRCALAASLAAPPHARTPTGASFCGAGHTLGSGGRADAAPMSAREAAAAAAMAREHSAQCGKSERDRKMADRRKRDELVGRIEAHYQAAGKDAPIGLASCGVDQLQRHLAHVKQETTKAAKLSSVRDQATV